MQIHVVIVASAAVWVRLTPADIAKVVTDQLRRPGFTTAEQLSNAILRSVDLTAVANAAVIACLLRYMCVGALI